MKFLCIRILTLAYLGAGMFSTSAHAQTACAAPDPGYTVCERYTYTGSDQSFTVPAGITSVKIKVWGAGGGGMDETYYAFDEIGGGAGGYATGTLAVTPGQTYTIVVGQGGQASNQTSTGINSTTYGGGGAGGDVAPPSTHPEARGASGGGYSGVFIGSVTQANAVMIAGGGGGGSPGATFGSVVAGGGGGTTGGEGDSPEFSGRGGTQTAGGAGATQPNNPPGACTPVPAASGSALAGGAGASVSSSGDTDNEGGGGGGGGYYGGGGGRCQAITVGDLDANGGGGGGSSYIGGAGLTAASTMSGGNSVSGSPGSGGAAANSGDLQYIAGVAVGGDVVDNNPDASLAYGGHGLVVIEYGTPNVVLSKSTSMTTALPGSVLVYTITATNTTAGTTQEAGYTFTEVVPANTTFTSFAAVAPATATISGCTAGAAAGTQCTITLTSALVNGTPAQVTFTVTPLAPLPAGTTSVVNQAYYVTPPATCSLSGSPVCNPDPPSGCAGGSCTPPTDCTTGDPACVNTPVASADMQATGAATQTVAVNTPVTVVTTCMNAGPDPAVNATCAVSGAPVGATTTCVPAVPAANLPVNGVITCTTTFTPTSPGTVTLTTAAGSDTPDPALENNTATSQVVVNTPATIATVKTLTAINGVAPTTGQRANAGDVLTYTIMSTNSGGTAGGTTLAETVPASTTYAGGGANEGTWTACVPGTTVNPGQCTQTQSVPANGSASVTFTVTVMDPLASSAAIVNTVTSSADPGCGSACTVTTPVASADMQATGPTTLPATVGTPVAVTTTCTNAGPDPAVNATCSVTGAPGGATTICSPMPPVAVLGAGASIVCTTTFTPADTTPITIVTTAHSDTPDPNLPNNTATTQLDPGPVRPTPPAQPAPLDARWMLVLMGLLLAAQAAKAMRKRGTVRGR